MALAVLATCAGRCRRFVAAAPHSGILGVAVQVSSDTGTVGIGALVLDGGADVYAPSFARWVRLCWVWVLEMRGILSAGDQRPGITVAYMTAFFRPTVVPGLIGLVPEFQRWPFRRILDSGCFGCFGNRGILESGA